MSKRQNSDGGAVRVQPQTQAQLQLLRTLRRSPTLQFTRRGSSDRQIGGNGGGDGVEQ
eukprot:SAG25_NODE_11995_length_290_cov_0.780105_1_plen_57_part_10